MIRQIIILSVSFLSLSSGLLSREKDKKDYPLQPVPFTKVRIADEFWAGRLEANRTVTIPFIFKKCEETGRIDNFRIAGGMMKGPYKGQRYNDTDVYKTLEGASYSLAVHPDPELEKYLDGLIETIAAAQEADGYLFTARTSDPLHPQPGIGAERWVEEAVSHELYNAGHLYEAAVAHFQATGKRSLLDIALKNADLVAGVFGPEKRRGFPGHQVIEMGLVKLFRATGEERYLNLAEYFLDQRGKDVKLTQYPPGSRFAIYNDPAQIQAHRPVLEQDEAVGHAVRAMYMYAGMADVAALAGREDYVRAVGRLWDNVISKKTALTGGVGARHERESFGPDYELPNLSSYNETCAAIGSVFWNHRMFLLTGDAKYLDVLERVLYNGTISGVSLEGNSFFYPNPLESDGKFKFNKGTAGRAPWFDVACCPGNIARFIPSLPGLIYAVRDGALFVNLFAAGRAEIDLGTRKVSLVQDTRYPWDGNIKISLAAEKPEEFTVYIRLPGWARNIPAPGGLYSYLVESGEKPAIRVNGAPASWQEEKGFAKIVRAWKKDTIELDLPMPVRRVVASNRVTDCAGKVALERGPIVYCAEWPDNGGRVLNLVLPDDSGLEAEYRPGLLKGLVVLKGQALARDASPDGAIPSGGRVDSTSGKLSGQSASAPKVQDFLAIPYYAWAHRGEGEMAVWLPRKVKTT